MRGDGAEVAPLQEVGPEGDGAAEVVPNDGWLVQPQMVEQAGEDPALGGQGDVLAFPLLRGAVPWEVEGVDSHRLGQCWDDPAPHVGGEGGAVDQHHRGSRSERLVAHHTLRRSVLLAHLPSIHRLGSPFRFVLAPHMMGRRDPSVHVLGVTGHLGAGGR